MDTTTLSSVFSARGPFATVLLDVSHDSENAEQEHELRVRAACDDLAAQGAHESLVETVRERVAEKVTRPAPVARLVVANDDGILYDEVAGFRVDQPVRAGADLVLLAGDPQSRPLVRERLSGGTATVVELESGTRAEDGGDEAMQQAIREALLEQVVQQRVALTHELKDRLGRENAASTGVRDVADAFVRGQVETLLLDPVAARDLTLDTTEHPGLVVGAEGELRADQALVAAAVLTGASVAVSPSATLGGAPVAALLRWHQDAVGDDTVDA